MMKLPSGYPIQSPYVSIANQQAAIMLRIASEFGYTAASRGRLPSPSNGGLMLVGYGQTIDW
jgi:phage terminase small subunit